MSAHAAASGRPRPSACAPTAARVDGHRVALGRDGGRGLLAYAFHILSARTLTTDEYGQIAALWAALFIAVVVLFRPLEQTTSRAVADRLARGQEATTVLRSVAIVYGCLLVFVGIAALLAWGTLTNGLFDGTSFMTAMLVVGIAGYGFQYVVRGILGGLRRFRGLSGIHVADGSVRLLVALPLLAVGSKETAAAALAAAGLLGAILPLWRSRAEVAGLKVGAAGEHFRLRAALRFAVPAGVIAPRTSYSSTVRRCSSSARADATRRRRPRSCSPRRCSSASRSSVLGRGGIALAEPRAPERRR